jgi:hypothetical protein
MDRPGVNRNDQSRRANEFEGIFYSSRREPDDRRARGSPNRLEKLGFPWTSDNDNRPEVAKFIRNRRGVLDRQ